MVERSQVGRDFGLPWVLLSAVGWLMGFWGGLYLARPAWGLDQDPGRTWRCARLCVSLGCAWGWRRHNAMACATAASLPGRLVGVGQHCGLGRDRGRRPGYGRGRRLLQHLFWWVGSRGLDRAGGRGRGYSRGYSRHSAMACPAGASRPGRLVGVGKHRGLGLGHGCVCSWNAGGLRAGNVRGVHGDLARGRGSARGSYRESTDLAVATTRARSLVDCATVAHFTRSNAARLPGSSALSIGRLIAGDSWS